MTKPSVSLPHYRFGRLRYILRHRCTYCKAGSNPYRTYCTLLSDRFDLCPVRPATLPTSPQPHGLTAPRLHLLSSSSSPSFGLLLTLNRVPAYSSFGLDATSLLSNKSKDSESNNVSQIFSLCAHYRRGRLLYRSRLFLLSILPATTTSLLPKRSRAT